ncbi:MAG: hypothetical protein JJW01_03150 [Alphaproteobacteria bacterium]|nr:hypothetical protein [Rickettsiales bacterium]
MQKINKFLTKNKQSNSSTFDKSYQLRLLNKTDGVTSCLFFCDKEKELFIKDLISVVNAVVNFYKYCTDNFVLRCGKLSEPDINTVITTVGLIAALLPNPICRKIAICSIKNILITNNGKIQFICFSSDNKSGIVKDCKLLGGIVHSVLRLYYFPSILKIKTEHLAAGKNKCISGLFRDDRRFGGAEALFGKKLSHLHNVQFKSCVQKKF